MTTEAVTVKNHIVYRDTSKTWRWFDAFGPSVAKWSFTPGSVVSTTTAAGQTVTVTNGTIVALDSATGGAVTFTLAGADNDKVEVQGTSEQFYFAQNWPCYFGIKFGAMVDADQTDLHAGLIIRDTDIAGGVTDGLYFRGVDEAGILALVLEKNTVETTAEIVTLAEATDYTVEFYYDGAGYVHAYLNGALVSSTATSNANWPNDEHLAGTIAVQAGEGTANNVVIYWARAIQIQEA